MKHALRILLCLGVPFFAFAQGIDHLQFQDATDGSPETLAQFHGTTTVLVFTRADCAPCRREIAFLPEFAGAHPETQFILVALGEKNNFNDVAQPSENLILWRSNQLGKKVLTAFGDTRSVLPFAAALNADGEVCARHVGLLGADRIEQWIGQC